LVNSLSEMADIAELCSRLHREANAQAVMILGQEGEILGHAGTPGALPEPVLDAVGDATAETLNRAMRRDKPDAGERASAPESSERSDRAQPAQRAQPGETADAIEADDHVAQVGEMQVCAASLGKKAVLVVVFDKSSNLALVRMRMKRARELILRSLDMS
jgi:hypothetical protein